MAGRDVLRVAAERTLTGLEPMVERVVQQALDEVAEAYAAHLSASAWELVAQGEPIGEDDLRALVDLWLARIAAILAPLLAVYGAAAAAVRRWLLGVTPSDDDPGVDPSTDPGRRSAELVTTYLEDPEALPERVRRYLQTAENRMRDVGDALWRAARETLADGVVAGDDMDALRDRLKETFAENGRELGDVRARRIARTEVISAWNAAALDEAQELTGDDRPLVKEWLSTLDERTRPAHFESDGQRVSLDEPFSVGEESLMFPGDPTSSPANCVNCRCTVLMDWDDETTPRGADRDHGRQFLTEEEVAEVIEYFEEQGIVREADQQEVTAASGGPYTGGMVALVPSQADIERLAVPGGELPRDLHLTLLFLGKGDEIEPLARQGIVDRLADLVADVRQAGAGPVEGHGFALSVFNPNDDERDSCIVLGVGGEDLDAIRGAVAEMVGEVFAYPPQHAPWVPHVTLTYTDDLALLAELVDRAGPIVFDRLRVAFGDDVTDILLAPPDQEADVTADAADSALPRRWSTPGDTALAFENQQTGDGRLFAPGSLYWEAGPWPLQYADEMLSGHEGAELAGAIDRLERDGDRVPATGVLYPGQASGAAAIRLLEEGAPLGVSVDLDDVDVELIDRRPPEERDGEEEVILLASLAAASVLPLPGGGHLVRATHVTEQTASGRPVRATHTVEWSLDEHGRVPAAELRAALTASGIMTAAAGDADDAAGQVVMAERSGDMVMRITRGRVRGATLVSMPAFAQARIVLDADEVAAACGGGSSGGRMRDVVVFVASSPTPVGAPQVADALGMTTVSARDYLARATTAGHLVRLARGLYVAASTLPETRSDLVAAMSGDLDLPIHEDRDAEWDGDEAASRVLAWATGDDGEVDAGRLGSAFLWRDSDANTGMLSAYRLGHADVFDGRLEIVPRAVFAVAGALQGARGGVDIPQEDKDRLRDRVEDLYERLAEAFGDPTLTAPWQDEEPEMDDLEASAWTEFQALPPLPAAWFREPTREELPPGSGGVHYAGGRIYGWVAQRGVPHEGFPGRNLTIESLGQIDTTTFLRTRFQLDDGSTVRVGAFTMNAPHHRDGAECESAACQFDDTRTVAGIVTVGMSSGGMWFSGAAAPWVSSWDLSVFLACQPSYHMRQERDGRWSLRAVLSVPVPGHPSKLAAAAFISRANTALAASARPVPQMPSIDTKALAAAIVDEMERRQRSREELAQMSAELAPARAELASRLRDQVTAA